MYVLIVVLYNYRLRLKEHISSKKSKDAYICSFFPQKSRYNDFKERLFEIIIAVYTCFFGGIETFKENF